MATKVIHIKDSKGTEDEVYVGRPGKGKPGYFGNPIAIDRQCPVCAAVHSAGGETLSCYQKYLDDRLSKDGEFKSRVRELANKTLVCFCFPKPCHGNLLAETADKLHTATVVVRKKDV